MSVTLSTKDRILDASLELFNENGIKNVRLQHIADKARLSIGNLAYHFPDMRHILSALERKIEEEIFKSRHWAKSSYFIDFDNRLIQYFHMMNRYSFYFLDSVEIKRSYNELHSKRLEYINMLISEIKEWLIVNEGNGFMVLPRPELVQLTAEMIWFIIAFWFSKSKILNKLEEDELAFRQAVWQQIIPYFTDKAKNEFEVLIGPKLFY